MSCPCRLVDTECGQPYFSHPTCCVRVRPKGIVSILSVDNVHSWISLHGRDMAFRHIHVQLHRWCLAMSSILWLLLSNHRYSFSIGSHWYSLQNSILLLVHDSTKYDLWGILASYSCPWVWATWPLSLRTANVLFSSGRRATVPFSSRIRILKVMFRST